jgi:diadenosine tetraphosphate (Ap4A) HIT family hydrolase
MKRECSVVRDILPLYLENMVSGETSAFVKEHLETCPECAAELETMKAEPEVKQLSPETRSALDAEVTKSMKAVRKKFRNMAYRVAAVLAAAVIAGCVLLHFFPVYRIFDIGVKYYSGDQIAMALSIGSGSDRSEAQAVLRLADQAFSDTRHTSAENEEAYGLLARYATSTDNYGDAAFNTHSLELWSAHLGADEGWIWVYYSSETFNHDGSTARGSWRVPSLWKVEKSDTGEWVVVQIREHP